MPLLFLDRDGTVIVDRGYLMDPAGVELLPGAGAGLAAIVQAGYELILVTNQSGVGRGLGTIEDVEAVNAKMLELLAEFAGPQPIHFSALLVCPHRPEAGCRCRKPETGLITEWWRKARGRDLVAEDLVGAYFVGDREGDIQCGLKLGLSPERCLKINGDFSPIAESILGASRFERR